MDDEVPPELAGHPDRLRWNGKYGTAGASFTPHRLAVRALSQPPPDGPVLDLACGPSGSTLLAAEHGRRVTAVDVSEVALALLDAEARRRGVRDLITLIHADLGEWTSAVPGGFALVLCTGYWDRAVFAPAADAVTAGGLLAWEAFTVDARRVRPRLPAEWCLAPGEPASLLPAGFTVLDQQDVPDPEHGTKRGLIARRVGPS
ncbi:class I SAM-dependent DNA methyltransferase [Actinomadura sp. 9N407]|uniref:class I SAM-dependent DNA methyltransferase n=1 Tax=Actinomadura sp. 9N407 TaxID=3375154 RepID=UPI00378F94D1